MASDWFILDHDYNVFLCPLDPVGWIKDKLLQASGVEAASKDPDQHREQSSAVARRQRLVGRVEIEGQTAFRGWPVRLQPRGVVCVDVRLGLFVDGILRAVGPRVGSVDGLILAALGPGSEEA